MSHFTKTLSRTQQSPLAASSWFTDSMNTIQTMLRGQFAVFQKSTANRIAPVLDPVIHDHLREPLLKGLQLSR